MALNNPIDVGVPPIDSTANITWGDILGNKLDTRAGNSLYTYASAVYDNVASPRLVYPTLAAGATVISANADWTYGAYAEVVPANTITRDFHILGISIESCDQNATFQLELYKGAADTIVTAVRYNVTGGFFGNQVYVVGSGLIEADSRIRARLASSDGLANQATITLSIIYWEHLD